MSLFLKNSDKFARFMNMDEQWQSDGTSPVDEEGVSVSQDVEYLPAMKAEAIRFRDAILNYHPIPEGCRAELKILRNSGHDFGDYLNLIAFADPEDLEAVEWTNGLEDLPMTWKELEKNTKALPPNEASVHATNVLLSDMGETPFILA
jgi:hypothetical protein